MTVPGHERWHPDPEFYYQPGGGPLLDMGPYYLTALVHLLGPVRRVTGMSSRPRNERTIGDGPRAGTSFPVGIDTHETGILEHASGALTTLIMSFDIGATHLPYIEVYGSTGFAVRAGPQLLRRRRAALPATRRSRRWTVLPPRPGTPTRAAAWALGPGEARRGPPHRAGADVALHVLDVMESVLDSAGERHVGPPCGPRSSGP